MSDLTPQARRAAAGYALAVDALRTARARLVAAAVSMDPINGLPPAWAPDQHNAVVEYSRAWHGLVLARSSWVATPKT